MPWGPASPAASGVRFTTSLRCPGGRRFARLDETIALWRHLWTSEGGTSFHGEFLRFDEIPPATLPYRVGGPPVWLGGATPKALDRTGHLYDGWLPYPPETADYRTGLARIRQAAADAGRVPDVITPALFVVVLIAESVERGREVLEGYSKAVYGLALEELETIQAVVTGPPGQVAAHLGSYADAGARHLVCRIGSLDLKSQREQLQLIADLVPLVRRP